jgi:hypothetical protein
MDSATTLGLDRVLTIAVVSTLGYTVLSLVVAVAVRRWARDLRFAEVPGALAALESTARVLGVSEVARFPARREYARVARLAADTLEQAATHASDVARDFGERLETETKDKLGQSPTSPYRDVVAPTHGTVAGTDAGGIYRTYPLYVHTVRALFAKDLADAVREYWPRVRGVFGDDARPLISEVAAAKLRSRLDQLRATGIRRGDLLQDGADPADEMAERLWHDPAIRLPALASLGLGDADSMPILATPADARLLDDGKDAKLIVAVPPTLQPLVREVAAVHDTEIVLTDALETATALRIFPFAPGLYDIVDFEESREESLR